MAEAVSIIVLCHDHWARTRRCLESLMRSTPPDRYELLAYDNASADETFSGLRRLARGWPQLRVFHHERNLPFAEGVNRGMRAGRGRYFLWLNNDTVLAPGWLDGLLDAAQSAPDVGAAGPMTDHAAPPEQIGKPFLTRASGSASQAAFLGGFCFLLKRDAAERAGMLDERFVWGWEDMDYCLRLRQAGWRLILARDVFVHHEGNRTVRTMAPAARRGTDFDNRELIARKWMQTAPGRDDLSALFRQFPAIPWGRCRRGASLIVLCRGDWARARACLGSIRRCAGRVSCDIMAAFLGAGRGAWRGLGGLARGWPELKVLGPWKDIPWTHAVNLALREARGENFVILPDDALVTREWLDSWVRAAAIESNIGLVGPQPDGARRTRRVAYLRGIPLLISRRVFDRIGAFDDRFAGPLAVVDYSWRAVQAGYQVLAAEGASSRTRRLMERAAPRDSRLLFAKWSGHPLFEAELRR